MLVLDNPNSDDLIRRAQEGDVRAFEALIETHIPRLRRFARSFARSDADADDLAQDALIKVYRSLRSYRFESSFSTWLYQVTKNCFMDARRAAASRDRAVAAIAENAVHGQDAEAQATAPDVLLLRAEERARLWAAIGGLSAEYRTVLVLCDVEGFAIAEVAAIEKLPEGTVKSRLHRGRAQLARLLQENVQAGNLMASTTVQPIKEKTLERSFTSPTSSRATTEGVDVP